MRPITKTLAANLPPLSDYQNAKSLAANVAETVTVPAGAGVCLLGVTPSSANVWVRSSGTASVPAADVSDGTASFPNPGIFAVAPADTFSVCADATAVLGIAFFAAPPDRSRW